MGALVAVLAFVACTALWVFFNFLPPHARARSVTVFNRAVLAVCMLGAGVVYLRVRVMFTTPMVQEYKEPVSLAAGLGFAALFLLVFFLLRNFWIFRPTRRPGSF